MCFVFLSPLRHASWFCICKISWRVSRGKFQFSPFPLNLQPPPCFRPISAAYTSQQYGLFSFLSSWCLRVCTWLGMALVSILLPFFFMASFRFVPSRHAAPCSLHAARSFSADVAVAWKGRAGGEGADGARAREGVGAVQVYVCTVTESTERARSARTREKESAVRTRWTNARVGDECSWEAKVMCYVLKQATVVSFKISAWPRVHTGSAIWCCEQCWVLKRDLRLKGGSQTKRWGVSDTRPILVGYAWSALQRVLVSLLLLWGTGTHM